MFIIKSNLETHIPEQFKTRKAARAELRRKAEFARPLIGVVREEEDIIVIGKGAEFRIMKE